MFHLGIISDQSAARTVPSTSLLTDRLVIHSSMTKAVDMYIRHISHRILCVYQEHSSQPFNIRTYPIQQTLVLAYKDSGLTSDKPPIYELVSFTLDFIHFNSVDQGEGYKSVYQRVKTCRVYAGSLLRPDLHP